MASSKDYLLFVLELLRLVPNINYKKMMGEYLLYQDATLFGGIYDDRFLVKKSKSLLNKGFKEVIPYPGAKEMLLIDIEDEEEIKEIVNLVVSDMKK